MFFKLLTLTVLLCVVSVAFSAVSRGAASIHPDHPGKCWDGEKEKAYAPDDVYTAPECTRVTCNKDYSFDYATCGVIATEPPCYIVDGDLNKPYPHCCPNIKCDS